jgi:hypothetical protein
VKNNKTGKNLQGNLNVILRHKEGGVWKIYQIKSNQTDSLAQVITSPTTGTANWTGKANLKELNNLVNPVSMGGLTFQITLTDKGEPGNTDTIGYAVGRQHPDLLQKLDDHNERAGAERRQPPVR